LADATHTSSIAIGYYAEATAENSIAIGSGSSAATIDTIVLGNQNMVQINNLTGSVTHTPTNASLLYTKSGELYTKDASGNETQLSPHNDDGEWQYFSRNTKTGKIVRIKMEKMIRKLEEITGETFIEYE